MKDSNNKNTIRPNTSNQPVNPPPTAGSNTKKTDIEFHLVGNIEQRVKQLEDKVEELQKHIEYTTSRVKTLDSRTSGLIKYGK